MRTKPTKPVNARGMNAPVAKLISRIKANSPVGRSGSSTARSSELDVVRDPLLSAAKRTDGKPKAAQPSTAHASELDVAGKSSTADVNPLDVAYNIHLEIQDYQETYHQPV